MLSWHLTWACMTPRGVLSGEQSALAGRRGPQKLLIGKPVPGRTALAECRGLQELLIGKALPGSTALARRRGPLELLIGKPMLESTSKSQGARAFLGARTERSVYMQGCNHLAM
jgi:hypothetical protein